MNRYDSWIFAINAICGLVNMLIYAYGSHDPANLAIGIINFFVTVWFNCETP